MRKQIDFVNDGFKVALCGSGYTFTTTEQDGHDTFSDLSDECAGTGYTAGGNALAGTKSVDTTTVAIAYFDTNADQTFTALDVTPEPGWAVLLHTASLYLMAIWYLTTASNGSDYKLIWAATGLIRLDGTDFS